MSKITIHQNWISAVLGEVCYHPNEGFQQDNTWHVNEETIRAELPTKLQSGPAEIRRNGKSFSVIVEVLQFVEEPAEERDEIEEEPVCEIEIKSIETTLPNLALELGLLDHLTKKQQRALLG